MRGKKPPPSYRLLSYAEILNIKAEAKRQGIMEAWIIFFSTLRPGDAERDRPLLSPEARRQ